MRTLVRTILVERGYDVLMASDGEQALSLSHVEPFDLLLTDMVMPKMSGTELAGNLRGTRPDLPVIYMSGYAHDVTGTDRLNSADAFIQKPFPPHQHESVTFTQDIREVLRMSHAFVQKRDSRFSLSHGSRETDRDRIARKVQSPSYQLVRRMEICAIRHFSCHTAPRKASRCARRNPIMRVYRTCEPVTPGLGFAEALASGLQKTPPVPRRKVITMMLNVAALRQT